GRALALALVGITSLGLALGAESLLYRGFHEYLPFFDRFRYPIKFILPLILVIALASAWGWEAFCRRAADSKTDSTRIRWTLLWLAAAGMIGVGIVDAGREFLTSWLMGSGIHPPDYNAPSINLSNLQRLLGFTSLFAFTLFLALRVRRGRAWCLRAAVGVFFLDIFFSVQGMYLTTPTGMLEKNSPATEFLQSDPDLFRVFVTPQSEKSATGRDLKREVRGNKIRGGSLPMEFRNWPGMYQVGGWNVLRKNKLIDFIEILQTPPLSARLPLLRMANVKYVVHAGAVPLGSLPLGFQDPSSNMPAEAADGADLNDRFSTRIYRNPGWLGRAYLVGACRVVTPDSAGWREALLDPGFDPVRQVVLEKSPTELPCTEDGPGELGAGAVTFLEVQPARTVLRVESAKKQFLLLSDSFFPGWEAEVDGTRVEILRANLAYRAIVMPAGGHEVVFTYRPGSFTLGLGITCLTLVLVGAGWLWETRQRPAPAPARAQSRETDFTVRPPGRGIIEDQATGAQASSP
ncbi:MAG: hypothetical protein ACE5ER_12620, partial [Nitrospinaceae bacterium]